MFIKDMDVLIYGYVCMYITKIRWKKRKLHSLQSYYRFILFLLLLLILTIIDGERYCDFHFIYVGLRQEQWKDLPAVMWLPCSGASTPPQARLIPNSQPQWDKGRQPVKFRHRQLLPFKDSESWASHKATSARVTYITAKSVILCCIAHIKESLVTWSF